MLFCQLVQVLLSPDVFFPKSPRKSFRSPRRLKRDVADSAEISLHAILSAELFCLISAAFYALSAVFLHRIVICIEISS